MAEEKLEGQKLKLEIAKYATRVGREASKATTLEKQGKLSTAIGLLNHAQGLVGFSDSKARRLLTSVKT